MNTLTQALNNTLPLDQKGDNLRKMATEIVNQYEVDVMEHFNKGNLNFLNSLSEKVRQLNEWNPIGNPTEYKVQQKYKINLEVAISNDYLMCHYYNVKRKAPNGL